MDAKRKMQKEYEKDLDRIFIEDFQRLLESLYLEHLKRAMRKSKRKK